MTPQLTSLERQTGDMKQLVSDRPFRIRAGLLIRLMLISCVCGAFLGVAARVTMRFVALEAGVAPAFSLGGSLEVVAFGALIGAPVALLFLGIRSQVHGWHPWLGVLCGASLFGVLSAIPPPAARSALSATQDTPAASAAAFGVLFVAWGWMLESVARRFLPASSAPCDEPSDGA
jgi:hypothetical protein